MSAENCPYKNRCWRYAYTKYYMEHQYSNDIPIRHILFCEGYVTPDMVMKRRHGIYAENFPSATGHNWCPDYYLDCHEYKRETLKIAKFNARKKRGVRDGQTPRVHIPFELRKRVAMKSKFGCVYCGRHCNQKTSRGPVRGAIDHVIPLALGGGNEESNLVLACRECNNAKADKLWKKGCRIGYYQP